MDLRTFVAETLCQIQAGVKMPLTVRRRILGGMAR